MIQYNGFVQKEEIYHEPHEPKRTTTRYVQKVRDVRVVRGKNSFDTAITIWEIFCQNSTLKRN
jgi:hypothetical protein